MLTLKLLVKDNWRTMIKVENDLLNETARGAQETANMIVKDIRSSWSGSSPSTVGHAPAYVTGVLDRSVLVDDQGRDESGRFANNKNAKAFYIKIDTAEEDDRGMNYAQALEDPDYLDRPFLAPALDRAEGYYTSNIKRFVRL